MITPERLDELKKKLDLLFLTGNDEVDFWKNKLDDIVSVLESEQQRRTVTDEEVRHSIGMIQNTIRNGKLNPLAIKCFDLAITALRQMQPKEPCEYCGDEEKPFYHRKGEIERMDSNIYISGNRMDVDLWQCGNSWADFEINFCPNCGRPLGKDVEK